MGIVRDESLLETKSIFQETIDVGGIKGGIVEEKDFKLLMRELRGAGILEKPQKSRSSLYIERKRIRRESEGMEKSSVK